MRPIQQGHGNSCRIVSVVCPPKDTLKKVRKTGVDTSNEKLWTMVKTLQEFFTRQLRAVAMPSDVLQSVPDKSVLMSITFVCAHDTLVTSAVQVTPHLIADCTEASKQLADVIAKYNRKDKQEQSYELIARNAEKAAKKAEKKLVKAEKVFAEAAKKLEKEKSNSKTKKLLGLGSAKAKKLLAKAQKAADKALAARDKLSKEAAEAFKKYDAASKLAEMALSIQSTIIQKWQGLIAKMKPGTFCVDDATASPACMESCQLHLAPAKGQCTFAI